MKNNNHLEKKSPPSLIGSLTVIVLAALLYTFIGVLIGALWAYGTSTIVSFPHLSIGQVIALWWAWIFVPMPPIIFAVNYFRVTDEG